VARLTTLIWLRLTLMRRSVRRGSVADAVVGVVLAVLGVAVAIGLAFSMGALATRSLTGGEDVLRVAHLIECYVLALLAIVVPVIVGRGSQSVKVSKLAFFPVSRRSLYALNLLSGATSGAHLLWYPALVAVTVNGVLRAPVNQLLGLLILLLLACLLVVWGQTVLLLLEALMRQRSVKELVIIVGVVVLVGLSLLPALVDSEVFGEGRKPVLVDILLEVFRPVAEILPASRAAGGLTALHTGDAFSFTILIAELLLWIGVGTVIGYLVLSRTLLEGRSVISLRHRSRPQKGSAEGSPRPGFDPWSVLPSGLAAIVVKELRYQLRSTPGKLSLLIAPMFVVMISLAVGKLMFAKDTFFGIGPSEYALYGVLLYAAVLTANFLVNAFAWEGAGIKAYILNPVAARDIILGKNIGVWIFNALMLAESLLVWSIVRGFPGILVAINGVLVFATCVLILTGVGNFVSIRFPVRRSIASLTNSSSQIGTIVTFASVLVAAVLVGAALVLGLVLGGKPAQLGLLALLVAILATANRLLLQPAADLFEERQEELVAAVDGGSDEEE